MTAAASRVQQPTLRGRDDTACRGLRWNLPPRLNMAAQICAGRAAVEPDRPAILDRTPAGVTTIASGQFDAMAGHLAPALKGERGDRIGVRTQSLAKQLRDHARVHCAAHSHPREAAFLRGAADGQGHAARVAETGGGGGMTIRSMLAAVMLVVALPATAAEMDGSLLEQCLAQARQPRSADTATDALPACVGGAATRCMEAPRGDSTLGMIGCLSAERDWWDARLNDAYGALHEQRNALQADLSPDDTPRPLDSLVEMERAWITWRDALCTYQGSDYPGGSLARVVMAQCQMAETARQALRLARDLDAAGKD